MAIQGFERVKFHQDLHSILSVSNPIDSPERLYGRSVQLDSLESALFAPGRHAFIYGDRGVGKSSLAHTAASLIQSSDNTPIIVSASGESTFESVLEAVRSYAISTMPLQTKASHKVTFNAHLVKVERQSQPTAEFSLPEITGVTSATEMLRSFHKWHSEQPVIVIDEFDTIEDAKERRKFGILLKQLGDVKAKVKLIFTGIAASLNELLDGHLSSSRQIHQVKLEPLPWNGRFEIIDTVFNHFGIEVTDDIRYRIAGLSDGFPHYVHLLCEHLLCAAFSSEKIVAKVDFELFLQGLDSAVTSCSETLRRDYDKATVGRDEHYRHLLWAAADSADLNRETPHIRHSYKLICESLSVEPINDEVFKRCFANLRKSNFGQVICRAFKDRTGWFRFEENIVRGFVRMQAELNQVTLDFERHFTGERQTARANASHSYYRPLNTIEERVEHQRSLWKTYKGEGGV